MILLACWVLAATSTTSLPLRIVVSDPIGGRVAGAEVVVSHEDATTRAVTAPDGTATVHVPPGATIVVSIRADGFAVLRRAIGTADPTAALHVTLEPARLETRVTVTATRVESSRTTPPPSTSVLLGADLASSPGFTLDDALRHTPGFSLFRRSSSRVANPTTQGVTLRGLSASGASRTLVLADGVPLNDPFGGWVSWNRVPLAVLERVEVVRGGAGDLYGPDALGGVVQLFTERPSRRFVQLFADAATQETGRGSLGAGFEAAGAQVLVGAELGGSRGYIPVAPESRGPIDEPAGGSYRSGLVRVGATLRGWQVSGGGSVFEEHRENGTPFQRNDTAARSATVSLARGAKGGYWRASGFVGSQGYDQTFSAVRPDRGSEIPTAAQRVPADTYGAATDWAAGSRVRVLIAAEHRSVRATNQETRYVAGLPASLAQAGGRQRFLGGFGQVAADLAPTLAFLAGARVEHWDVQSFQGDDVPATTVFAPRVALAWRPRPELTVRGSVGRAQRSPTLNERYRGFRVGDTQTLPNAMLEPERLTTWEAGGSWTLGRATVRSTVFAGHLADAITNVTLSTTPALTLRQRRNLGSIEARGLEFEASARLGSRLHAEVASAFIRSRFGDGAPPGLSGNRTPQSPLAHVAAELRWDDLPRVSATVRALAIGQSYEDDLNTLVLRRATVLDVMVSRVIAPRWLAFAAVENVADEDYDVGRTPLRTIGSPRLIRAGVRLTWR